MILFGTLKICCRYKRELAEWAAVLEERKQVTEQAKEGYSKEKHLHFLKLPARDVEPLKSFLSPEQLSLIESEDSSEFVGTTNQQLDLLVCTMVHVCTVNLSIAVILGETNCLKRGPILTHIQLHAIVETFVPINIIWLDSMAITVFGELY